MNFRVLTAGSVEGGQVISRDMLLVVETSDKGAGCICNHTQHQPLAFSKHEVYDTFSIITQNGKAPNNPTQ